MDDQHIDGNGIADVVGEVAGAEMSAVLRTCQSCGDRPPRIGRAAVERDDLRGQRPSRVARLQLVAVEHVLGRARRDEQVRLGRDVNAPRDDAAPTSAARAPAPPEATSGIGSSADR